MMNVQRIPSDLLVKCPNFNKIEEEFLLIFHLECAIIEAVIASYVSSINGETSLKEKVVIYDKQRTCTQYFEL